MKAQSAGGSFICAAWRQGCRAGPANRRPCRAFLVSAGREIHGEAGDGELQPGVAYRGPDPVARLAHGGIGQPDDLELRQALGERALDGHLIAADALYSQRANTRDHGRTPLVYFPNAVSAMARTASIMKLMSSPAVTLGKPWAK